MDWSDNTNEMGHNTNYLGRLTMSETSETATTKILVKARELIAEPEHWVQGVEREGDNFCSIGAIKEAWVTTVFTDG